MLEELPLRAVLFAAVVVLALSALPVGAWASPSLLGPTGLIFIPTANTLGMTEFNVGERGSRRAGVDENALFANVGVFPGLEVGATRVKLEGAPAETMVNAKYCVSPLGPASVAAAPLRLSFAVGVIDLTNQIDETPYIVASHTLGAGLLPPVGPFSNPQVHVGYGSGQLDGLFGGFSMNYHRSTLMAEYDGRDVNFGAKIPLASKLEVTAAALNGLNDYAVGLSFSSPW